MILAHMDMTGGKAQSKLNGARQNEQNGANVEKGSGHGRQRVDRHTACRTGTAGGHSQRILRPAQASNKQPAVGRPCSKHNSCRRRRPAFRRAVQVDGGSAMILALRKAGSDLPNRVPTPPIAFACHCLYPLPEFVKPNLAPN